MIDPIGRPAEVTASSPFVRSQSLSQDAVPNPEPSTQEGPAGAREQDPPFPQTQLRAAVEFAERSATGTRSRASGKGR